MPRVQIGLGDAIQYNFIAFILSLSLHYVSIRIGCAQEMVDLGLKIGIWWQITFYDIRLSYGGI